MAEEAAPLALKAVVAGAAAGVLGEEVLSSASTLCPETACASEGPASLAGGVGGGSPGGPLPIVGLVRRPLAEEERRAAWQAANFNRATSGQERPIALWLLGPSSVGKSTLVPSVAPDFGLPVLEELGGGRPSLDAVLVDGEFIRQAHGGWQQWVRSPDWRLAYPALKSVINQEKERLCAEAVSARKHLVLPHTLLNLHKGLTEMENLARCGYTNHVLAVVAPLEECRRRGLRREVETGKRYQPLEFELSISAIPRMVEACNGRYELVRAVELATPEEGMAVRVLQQGLGGRCAVELDTAGEPCDLQLLQTTIHAVIGGVSEEGMT